MIRNHLILHIYWAQDFSCWLRVVGLMIFGLNVIIHMYDNSYLRDRMIITNQPGLDSHRWLSLSLSLSLSLMIITTLKFWNQGKWLVTGCEPKCRAVDKSGPHVNPASINNPVPVPCGTLAREYTWLRPCDNLVRKMLMMEMTVWRDSRQLADCQLNVIQFTRQSLAHWWHSWHWSGTRH